MLVKDNPYIPQEDRDFFILLRIGLWQTVTEQLSDSPNWAYIYQLACEQTVQGIIADGIGLYRKEHPELRITQEQNDKFLSASAQIVRQNFKVNQVQTKLCEILANSKTLSSSPLKGENPAEDKKSPFKGDLEGLSYVVLKGQGVAQSYPKPMLRCSGDIDYFFTPDNYQRAKELLIPLSATVEDKLLSLECALTIEGVDVELHGAMTSGINRYCDQHLQVILDKVLTQGDTRTVTINGSNITLPSANFDALYILIHTIRHLGAFGISLRQVIDWVMLLQSNKNTIDMSRLQQDLKAMHLQNLWNLFMSFSTEYLGLDIHSDFLQDFEERSDDPSKNSSTKAKNERIFSKILVGDSCKDLQLWQIIRSSGSFGHKNPYFDHLHAGRLNERLSRIYYRTKQALVLRQFDREFSNYLLRHELKDTFIAPFRFLKTLPSSLKGR